MSTLRLENVTIRLRPLNDKPKWLCWTDRRAGDITTSRPLIADLDLSIGPGELTVVMGKSGVGKSTLLSYITGSLSDAFEAAGRIWIDDKDVTHLPPRKRRIGILFQDDLLFPHLSVGVNLAFGIPDTVPPADRRRRVDEALDRVGLEGFYGRDPLSLSGGQRARVALMRTLLSEPVALLLDEPFGKLDPELKQSLVGLLVEHIDERRIPAMVVTHDREEARLMGHNVVFI